MFLVLSSKVNLCLDLGFVPVVQNDGQITGSAIAPGYYKGDHLNKNVSEKVWDVQLITTLAEG